jgi:hypothetical protein
VHPDAIQSANAKRRETAFMLEASKLALDRSAAAIERSEARRLAWDQRVQTVGVEPDRRGPALAGRAAPLARPAL